RVGAQGGVLGARVRVVATERAAARAVAAGRHRGTARRGGGLVGVVALRAGRSETPAAFLAHRPARDRGGQVIFFVRHGETALNRDGRLQGRIDLDLSERGGEQVARVARRFASGSLARVYTSPLRRAQQTAAAIAAASGADVEVDDRLLELDYGEWDGKPP